MPKGKSQIDEALPNRDPARPPAVNDDPADSRNKPGFGVEALPWSASKSHNRWANSICAEREPNGPGGEGNEPGRAGISRGAESLVEVIESKGIGLFRNILGRLRAAYGDALRSRVVVSQSGW